MEHNIYFDFKDNEFSTCCTTSFCKFINSKIICNHTPHHNGYDMIFKAGEIQYIEGKFQYGDLRKDLEKEWVSIYRYSFSDLEPLWKRLYNSHY